MQIAHMNLPFFGKRRRRLTKVVDKELIQRSQRLCARRRFFSINRYGR